MMSFKRQMNLKLFPFLLLCLVVIATASRDRNKKPYKVVCYFKSWANYREGDGNFTVNNINPHLCTHLVYGFAKLEGDKIASVDPHLDLQDKSGLGFYKKFNDLKKKNSQLTTLIAIGGWNENFQNYSNMVSSSSSRYTFKKSVLDFLKKHNFDGLDLHWEYTANRSGAYSYKRNFISLLRELKTAFTSSGFILSAAVSARKEISDDIYNIPEMNKYLDFINLKAYDMHGSWDNKTGHNAPLYSQGFDSLNVHSAIRYWIQKRVDPGKLILGMSTYGRSFTLSDPSKRGLNAQTKGPGEAGNFTKSPGMLGYNEICLKLKQGWTETFPTFIKAPYAFKGNQWVGYDDVSSIKWKVDYLKREKLGGGMVWSLDTDDFRGKCSTKKFPLLATIASRLNNVYSSPTLDAISL